ncbi:Vacuolar protein sorting-associated protein 13B, partial [Perkinsus olseni]
MFTRLVSSIANSYIVSFLRDFLSGYVDNVDPAQLKASLDKGEVSLSALRLKRDIFDFLSIPVTVVIGLQRAGRSESYVLQPVDGELRIMTTKVPTRTGPNECFSPHDGEWIPKGMGNNCSH